VLSRLILASASPRRRELLNQIGLKFEVIVSSLEEKLLDDLIPKEQAKRIALSKAEALGDLYPGDTIIAADTIVVLDNTVLGKPVDREQAREMLQSLNGRKHQVITGFAVIHGQKKIVDAEQTEVFFRRLSGAEIENYLDSGEYIDKAGAYGIQGLGCLLVERIEGCYFNVVGLPLSRLYQVIKQFGYQVV
jgi:septum formation protein